MNIRLLLGLALCFLASNAYADAIIGTKAETIWRKGEVLTSGVKADDVTEKNLVALISYERNLHLCEAYVNVPLSQLFIKCFDQ